MNTPSLFDRLIRRLDLAVIEPGVYAGGAGEGGVGAPSRLFGGMVAAQAAMAAIGDHKAQTSRQTGPVRTAYDLDSLASAKTAADFVTKLAKQKYNGQLHVLLNNVVWRWGNQP